MQCFFEHSESWRWLSGKESACQCRRPLFDPWVGKIPWRSKWQASTVFLPGESHGQRSLADYSPWGHKRSQTVNNTKQQQQAWEVGKTAASNRPPFPGRRQGPQLARDATTGVGYRQVCEFSSGPPDQGPTCRGFPFETEVNSQHLFWGVCPSTWEWGCRDHLLAWGVMGWDCVCGGQ